MDNERTSREYAKTEIYCRFTLNGTNGVQEMACDSLGEAADLFIENHDIHSAFAVSFDAQDRLSAARDVTAEIVDILKERVLDGDYPGEPSPVIADVFDDLVQRREEDLREQHDHELHETAALNM